MSVMLRNPKPVALFWSTGKDSALALFELKKNSGFRVELLVLTVSKNTQRVSMHGIPADLALQQAKATGIPVYLMEVTESSTNAEYEKEIEKLKKYLSEQKIRHVAFGDIFLEDLKKYRENLFFPDGFELVFPLWRKCTQQLLDQFIKNKFKAVVVCCNAVLFPKEFCGRPLDENFSVRLPKNVDPCGENGEFHTFCFDGPVFKTPVRFKIKGVAEQYYSSGLEKHKFYFSDIVSE